jgi:hypothetical protein
MSAAEFVLTWYALGTGAALLGFWSWVAITARTGRMGEGRDDFGWHVAAEMVAGGLLVVAGLGLVFARDARWPDVLLAVGIGAVIYAITESAGHYLATGQRLLAAAVAAGWVFTIPALVLVLVT